MNKEAMDHILEDLGESQVRIMMQYDKLPPAWHVHAIEWLARKDKDKSK